jgi:excinuclease ABC subunit A
MPQKIILKNVRVHNLKSVSLTLEPNQLICFTGISGSGKTSMAFDTIYVEGQRRYVESLSGHVKRFLTDLQKPDFDFADGITPTISIEQKTAGKNPRSTVGTITEIYDYMRLLWARIGTAYCPESGERVSSRSTEEIIDEVLSYPEGRRIMILAPYARNKKGEFKDDLEFIAKKGFTRIRIDNTFMLVDAPISLDKNIAHDLDIVVDRVELSQENTDRVIESLHMALELGDGNVIVYTPDLENERFLSTRAYSATSKKSYPALDPQDFSFNSPQGACPECHGLGICQVFDLEKVIDPEKSIQEDSCIIASSYNTVRYGNIYANLASLYDFSLTTPWKELSDSAKKVFLYGTEKKWTRMHFVHPETGAMWHDTICWQGVLHDAYKRYQQAKSEKYKHKMQKFMHTGVCTHCHGERLKPYPRVCEFSNKRIGQVCHMTIDEALSFFSKASLTKTDALIADEVLKEIIFRLTFLQNVGLGYLQLDRTSPTLSGGESQRVRLASQIGSGLVGITYILDEPSIGLHAQDNVKLIESLLKLRDKGNSVIVIEHDEETIRSADHVVDFGPKAGLQGGECVFDGPVKKLLACKESLTGQYLAKKRTIDPPKVRRDQELYLTIKGARHNNLKNIDVSLPLATFIAVTGVSGSGKSSLFLETLYPALSNRLHKSDLTEGAYSELVGTEFIDKVIVIDQSPIGRTPRSNPATYIKLFDLIRNLFSELPQSKAKGFGPGRFSFNVQEGSCSECHGMGQIAIDMDFLQESWLDCPTCGGKRFDPETLEVRYKEKNIQDVLEMDVQEAKSLFANIPHIQKKLDMLIRVGLDYIKLGQSSTTLSGGEAQRIKLVRELARPDTGKTLYILDEPTTGLHFHDIHHLLEVIQALVDKKNTVVVIEHNIDLIKCADYIIEMGPSSGEKGGECIAKGTPEELIKTDCPTAKALRHEYTPPKYKKRAKKEANNEIIVQNAEQNNLKGDTISIPRGKISVCTGPSGSGKSSFAFETLFSEGQRRYVESLSPYIRQFVKQMPKPKVGAVSGISASIAIEARQHNVNPRSTVGTMTEIYDYLRILYARKGIPHCPKTGKKIQAISKEVVVDKILALPEKSRIYILAPIELKRSDTLSDVCNRLQSQGFLRVRINGNVHALDEPLTIDSKRKQTLELIVDRMTVDSAQKGRLYEAVSTAACLGKKKVIVMHDDGDLFFNLAFAVVETGESYPEITPQTFAFNTPQGMCPDCQGLGMHYGIDFSILPKVLKTPCLTLLKELIPHTSQRMLSHLFKALDISPYQVLNELHPKKYTAFLQGSDTPFSLDGVTFYWRGLQEALTLVIKHTAKDQLPLFFDEFSEALCAYSCQTCAGSRITSLARHVTIQEKSIADLTTWPLSKTRAFLSKLCLTHDDGVLEEVHTELLTRLGFLEDIGLGYLSLNRSATTLSGGEAQRTRLARQIGSGLTSVLYVLDEPTSGLHATDCVKLLQALKKLKTLGNTLCIVEHDSDIIRQADHIVEFGPESGAKGGHVVAQGALESLPDNCLTKKYLQSATFHGWQKARKKRTKMSSHTLEIKNASVHNLQNINVSIPTGSFTCITGVSGSGKSSLLEDVLKQGALRCLAKRVDHTECDTFCLYGMKAFSKCIVLDQKPQSQTLRSDIATYSDVLTPIRHFYASLPEAQIKGLEPKYFSTYHRKGMCTHCWGLGYKRIEMHFLPRVQVPCPKCHGMRLNPLSLTVSYKGKNVGELLQMPIDELSTLFEAHPKIMKHLKALQSVGLGYILLGQEVHTLSNGEMQRLKLSRELAKRVQGKALYLFDEPTTGLHPQEVQNVVMLIDGLVGNGHTVVAIEHNLEFIASSEHIIDLGPGAADEGGKVVFSGKLGDSTQCTSSQTGQFLKKFLR